MSFEEILDKKIENYIHNRLSPEERLQFENELVNNEELRKNVKLLLSFVTLYNEELYNLKLKLEATEIQLNSENFFNDNPEE